MDLRRMRPADVERAGGPSRQVLSKLLNDNRDSLDRRPDSATVQSLAKAFGIPVEKVLASVVEAMGLPTSVTVAGLETASNEELLDEIRRRMERTHDKHATTHDHHTLPGDEQSAGRERGRQDEGPDAGTGEKTTGRPSGAGLDQIDFDLAAHPPMGLQRDQDDALFDTLGEEDQDEH